MDYDGRVAAKGCGAGNVHLGRLPVGYYEVQGEMGRPQLPPSDPKDAAHSGDGFRSSGPVVAVAVLAPLKAPPTETSPIDCDVAMASACPKAKMPAAANLCALAGVNWVRDRFVWRELEPVRSRFVAQCLYDDSATIQAAAGLKILQVNHSGPTWSWERRRSPSDLRDAYRIYREAARRWKGKVLAFEPWNEADIVDGSGQTGSEMASMQKATYLGLKAGNPRVIACTIPFAGRTSVTLKDFHANQAWPYFDAFSFHVYKEFDEYPATYADFRAVSAGRPLWITETNVPLPWPGPTRFKEPTDVDRATQADRVAKIFAESIHEGSAATFYFLFHEYIEQQMELGVLRRDLTPRPAYVALAAVGRLLADAHPLGKLRTDNPRVRGFLFRAKPDGNQRVVLVAWSTDRAETQELPVAPAQVYDLLGRVKPVGDTMLDLLTAPTIAIFGADADKLQTEPPPAASPGSKASRRRSSCRPLCRSSGSCGKNRPTPSGRASSTASRSTFTTSGPKRLRGGLRPKVPKTGISIYRSRCRRRRATALDWG